MTTFKAVVGPAKKDGTYNVKIRMTHNAVVKYIPTALCVERGQLRRNGEIKDPDVIDAVTTRYIRRMRSAVQSLDSPEAIPADRLKDIIIEELSRAGGFRLDVFEYAAGKTAAMKPATRGCYDATLSALRRFLGRGTLDINDIDTRFVTRFREFLESEPVMTGGIGGRTYAKGGAKRGGRAVSLYLSRLKTVHGMAREEYNDYDTGRVVIPREPFRRGSIPPQPVTRHRTLTPEQVRLVAAAEAPTRRAAMARDVFLLSFALAGMNSADIYHCSRDALKGGVLTYNRLKTASRRSDGAEIQIRVEPEAERYMAPYLADRGGTLFVFSAMYADHKNFNKALNRGLKELNAVIAATGGEVPELTFYHARHSWATIARNACGVGRDVVAEALNHAGTDRVTDIYIERSFARIWEANRRVLDYVFRGNG